MELRPSLGNLPCAAGSRRATISSAASSRVARLSPSERLFSELLETVDVRLDGGRPWDLRVHDSGLFDRVLAGGASLAFGDSYVEGGWDCERLDQFFCRVLAGSLQERLSTSARALWVALRARMINLQSKRRAFIVGRRHYDLGNEFFSAMLDRRMTYSCAYWNGADSLAAAQEAKLELICRKIGLQAGQRILDIGCGWGSFAGYAAERHGARVVGVTVSGEQARYARERYAGLPVEVRLQDYRELRETFDHVVSVGMFEHVGPRNYRTFMATVARCLAPEGCFLLHTIGQKRTGVGIDPWIERYIFPNGALPSARQITEAAEELFVLRDWHAFGRDYDPTLMAWHANCERIWAASAAPGAMEERFRRMWRYYLLACAGSFRADDNQLWQVLFSRPGCRSGDATVR